MAFFLRANKAEGAIPTWTATGDFTVSGKMQWITNNDILMGRNDSFEGWIGSISGKFGFKIGTASAVISSINVVNGELIDFSIVRVGSLVTATYNGQVVTQTNSQAFILSNLGGNANGAYNRIAADIYRLQLINGTDNRDYDANASGGTGTVLPDANEPSGDNDINLLATYSWISYTASDTTAPVITLLGSPTVTVTEGATYTDAGATASDDIDGDITANIVTVNPVDTATPAVYTITYNVSDAEGNPATQVTRTVTVEAAGVDSISLASAPFNNFVYQQGSSGAVTITRAVSFTGAPTSLRYRLLDAIDNSIVTDWTVFDASPTGGTSSLSISVSGSLTGYHLQVGNQDASVTSVIETNDWYVGDVIAFAGQSLAAQMTTQGDVFARDGYFQFNGTAGVQPTIGKGALQVAFAAIEGKSVACMIIPTGVDGSPLTAEAAGNSNHWSNTSSALFTDAINKINSATGGNNELSFLYWHQGTADSNAGVSQAVYESNLTSLFANFRANIDSEDGGILHFYAATLGRYSIIGGGNGATDASHTLIRNAIFNVINADANITPLNAYPIQLRDGVHGSDAGYTALGQQIAILELNRRGVVAAVAPSVSTVSINEARTEVDILLDADLNPSDTVYDTEGIEVKVAGVTAAISSFTKAGTRTAKITLASAIDPAVTVNVYFGYGIGETYNALVHPRTAVINMPNAIIDTPLNANLFQRSISSGGELDTTKPVIIVTQDISSIVDLGGVAPTFTATAFDNVDGDITADIIESGDTVDVNTKGSYTRRWNVSDTAGNVATEETRTVLVRDPTEGIPIEFRGSPATLNAYLITQSFTKSITDNISNWLSSEGFSGTINDKMYAYLGSKGYTGALNDRLKDWEEG